MKRNPIVQRSVNSFRSGGAKNKPPKILDNVRGGIAFVPHI